MNRHEPQADTYLSPHQSAKFVVTDFLNLGDWSNEISTILHWPHFSH